MSKMASTISVSRSDFKIIRQQTEPGRCAHGANRHVRPCVMSVVQSGAIFREEGRRNKLRVRCKATGSIESFESSGRALEFECPPQGCLDDLTAQDIMTKDPCSIGPNESIFAAMEALVEKGISGIAVIDEEKKVLGVVSAYDVLALDCTPGTLDKSDGFFPPIDKCRNEYEGDRSAMWRAFLGLRKSIEKAKATMVGDSMHETFTVSHSTSLSDVADLIVRKRLHRVFVVGDDGALSGVISRGDVMRVTIKNFRALQASEEKE